jgi:hypothetical protein
MDISLNESKTVSYKCTNVPVGLGLGLGFCLGLGRGPGLGAGRLLSSPQQALPPPSSVRHSESPMRFFLGPPAVRARMNEVISKCCRIYAQTYLLHDGSLLLNEFLRLLPPYGILNHRAFFLVFLLYALRMLASTMDITERIQNCVL